MDQDDLINQVCDAQEEVDALTSELKALTKSANPESGFRKSRLLEEIMSKKLEIKKMKRAILAPEESSEEPMKEPTSSMVLSRGSGEMSGERVMRNMESEASVGRDITQRSSELGQGEHIRERSHNKDFEVNYNTSRESSGTEDTYKPSVFSQAQGSQVQWSQTRAVPTRLAMGIDKGIKASDIKLRPKPSSDSSFAQKYMELQHNASKKSNQKDEFLMQRLNGFGMTTNVGSADIQSIGQSEKKQEVELFSNIRIDARYIEETDLGQEFREKKILTVSRVLAKVSYPDYDPLPYPNYVVMGVVAKKDTSKLDVNSQKYMTLSLTDFKMNIDIPVIIMGPAYDLYWTVREGSLIAILNPETFLLSEKNGGETSYSVALKIATSDNCIIEVGRSSDLGWCAAITAKGKRCKIWINARKATYCEYHIDQKMRKTSQQRMEFNSVTSRTFSPTRKGRKEHMYMSSGSSAARSKLKTHISYDKQAPRRHNVGASFSDAFMGDALDGGDPLEESMSSKSTAKRRKNKRAEDYFKEKQTRERLAQLPGGHYLKHYDEKGVLIPEKNPAQETTGDGDSTQRLFSAKRVRILGFDPTKQKYTETAKNNYINKVSATEVSLKKPARRKVTTNYDDDDDDLDII